MLENNNIANKKRIEYIDAMRGFTMFLVVYTHIEILCMGFSADTFTFNHPITTFRMPLFFFISGWVMYKAKREWNSREVRSFLGKKFMIQIIPTVFFMSLFILTFNIPITKECFAVRKLGYWFTYMLFQYFLFYVITMLLVPKKLKGGGVEDFFVVAGALIVSLVSICSRLFIIHSDILSDYIGSLNWFYYFFFCLGALVKKHFNSFIRITDNKMFLATVIITALLLTIIREKMDNYPYIITFSLSKFIAILLIVIIFTYFRKNEYLFTKEKFLGKWLQYIGRRTLDIYLLHFFFLPFNLRFLGLFFMKFQNPTVEFFVCVVFALMVTVLTLILSNIIRLSPFLAEHLFGVKEKKNI